MGAPVTDLVGQEQVDGFHADGAVALRGVFGDWIETLRAGVERNLAEPGPDARVYESEGAGGRFVGDYCNWDRIPEYREFVFRSPAAAIGQRLMGSHTVRLFHEHVLVKEPGAEVATPWHQDGPYYCVSADQTVSLWIPLDPVARETTPEFVGGSHLWGEEFRPERFNRTPLVEGDTRKAVPDVEGHRDEYRILGWRLEPGDAVAFHYTTLHGAPANTSTRRRRAFSVRLLGDGARFRRMEGPTSPPFRSVTLADGAPLDGPEFPLLLEG
jgi:ectoine hydroxylase-related dioxygenase (phytanoyl-CoA dioxygenase family)